MRQRFPLATSTTRCRQTPRARRRSLIVAGAPTPTSAPAKLKPTPAPAKLTPCPSGCGCAVTWHPTHCCEACRLGQGHGPRCDRKWGLGPVTKQEAQQLVYRAINPPQWQKALAQTLEAARHAKASDGPRRLDVDTSYPGLRSICADPPIYIIDDFLSAAECDAMVAASTAMKRSVTSDKVSEIRTSSTCYLARDSPESLCCFQRISRLLSQPHAAFEDVQVARYMRGQSYQGHFDGADPLDSDAQVFFRGGGQRTATVLIYLNTPESGGGTRFAQLDLEVTPKRGSALVFFPGFIDGTLDRRLWHEALPAVSTKWVSQIWVRQLPDPVRSLPKEWVEALEGKDDEDRTVR